MFRSVVVCVVALSSTAFAQSFPECSVGNAKTAKAAQVSLTPDGPWLGKPVSAEQFLAIYDDSSSRPRFAEHNGDARLLFYVDRDALHKAITTRTLVQPTATATPDKDLYRSVGYVASPGTTIETLDAEQNGLVRVRIKSSDAEITGFVAAASIGTTYQFDFSSKRPAWKPDAQVANAFALLDQPKGTAFVQVSTGQSVMVLQRKAGFALVRLGNGAVGWLAQKQLGKIPRSTSDGEEGGEEGGVAGGVVGGTFGERTLEENTPLFDKPDGIFVGVAAMFDHKPIEKRGTWLRYELNTMYGKVTVWSSTQKKPEQPPQNVPPTLLESYRISGEKNLIPDDDTKTAIQQSGKSKVVGSWKLCLDRAGAITVIKKLKSTGFDAYDRLIEVGMAQWKYKPFDANGKPMPVCTAITFIYSQK